MDPWSNFSNYLHAEQRDESDRDSYLKANKPRKTLLSGIFHEAEKPQKRSFSLDPRDSVIETMAAKERAKEQGKKF